MKTQRLKGTLAAVCSFLLVSLLAYLLFGIAVSQMESIPASIGAAALALAAGYSSARSAWRRYVAASTSVDNPTDRDA
jgi:hypothetical protein